MQLDVKALTFKRAINSTSKQAASIRYYVHAQQFPDENI